MNSSDTPINRSLNQEVMGLVIAGLSIIGIGLGGLIVWGATVKLESAALASGVVAPYSGRKTIQHLEGGIIKEIRVRDGSTVKSGDLLIVLDDTRAKANYDLLRRRYLTSILIRARLEAERERLPRLPRPAEAQAPEWDKLFETQRRIFHAHRAARLGQLKILDRRIAELQNEITGIKEQRTAARTQIKIIGQQIADVKPLVEKGFARRPRLLALQAKLAEVTGNVGKFTADIARAEQKIKEAEIRKVQIDNELMKQVTTDLKTTQTELSDLTERVRAAEDILNRTHIKATVDGTVTGLRFKTIGGVIPAGEPILDIVPSKDKLIIEAQVKPDDIDVVHPGLPVNIRLTALSRRHTNPLKGSVIEVSPDRIISPSGHGYFKATVEVDPRSVAKQKGLALHAGMSAQLEIITGKRTVLEYILSPIVDSLGRAFREQ